MPQVDFHLVRNEIQDAARRSFSLVRAEHARETFYSFALWYGGEGYICSAANTEEGYQRCLKKYEEYRKDTEAALSKSGMTYPDYMNYYRWCTSEWAYCDDKANHFERVNELTSLDHGSLLDPFEAYEEFAPDTNAAEKEHQARVNAAIAFQARAYGAMVLGLKQLDAEGFFGRGTERESVTLLCSDADNLDTVWLGIESAHLLNPPVVFDAFLAQWMRWQGEQNKRIIAKHDESEAYCALKKFLLAEGVVLSPRELV
jgi:hypothetical protein